LAEDVVAVGVDVFGVEEKTVHIEETGAYFRGSAARRSICICKGRTKVHILRICHHHDCGIEAEAIFRSG